MTFEAFTSAVYTEIEGVKCAVALIKWGLYRLNDLVSIVVITGSCFCFAFFSDPLENLTQLSVAFLVLFELNVSSCASAEHPKQN